MGVIGDILGFVTGNEALRYEKDKDTHLTGAQREANSFTAAQAEIARDWQERMYERYQSPSAIMAQYREAGLNPALMYGGASSGSIPTASSGLSSVTPSGGNVVGALQSLAQLAGLSAHIENLRADTAQKEANANKTEMESSWIDAINNLQSEKLRSEIASNLQSVRESASRISVNNSTVEVNDHKIELMGSERDLNVQKTMLEKVNTDNAQVVLQYMQEVYEANIALTKAQTEKELASADELMSKSCLNMIEHAREQGLIDMGYYESLKVQIDENNRRTHRETNWLPFQNIMMGVSGVIKAASGVAVGASALKGAGLLFE